ncbi:9214_t:CDS:1, partial [Scutellospora calospora]
ISSAVHADYLNTHYISALFQYEKEFAARFCNILILVLLITNIDVKLESL